MKWTSKTSTRTYALALLGTALAGLTLRFRFLSQTLGESRVFLFGADPYYHARRARLIVERFPDLVYTDPFQNFPNCEPCSSLPAGFDALLALLSLIMPGETVAARVSLAGVLVVPLLGMVTLGLLFALIKDWLPRAEQAILLLLAATLPAFVDNSFAGRVDHHVLDPLSALALLALLAQAMKRAGRTRLPLGLSITAGVVGGVALVSFPSALVTVTLSLGAGLLAAIAMLLQRQDPRRVSQPVAAAGLVAGAIQWAFMALFTPCFGSTTLIANTLFPGLLAMGVGSVALALSPLCHFVGGHRKRTTIALSIMGIGALAATGLVLLSPGLQKALWNWWTVMAGNVIPELSPEWRSLWRTPVHWFTGKFTWGFILIPPGLVLLVLRGWRDSARHPSLLLLAGLTVPLLLLAVIQAKYFVHFYAPVATVAMVLFGGWTLRKIWAWLPVHGRLRAPVGALAGLTMALLLVLEPLSHYRAVQLIHWQTADVLGLLDWIRQETPEPDIHDPEYGIMNTWETGFWVAEAADRPVYANNFVAAPPESVYIRHLARAYEILLDGSPERLVSAMDELRTPYLLLIPVDGGKLYGYHALVEKDPNGMLVYDEAGDRYAVGPGFLETNFAHLFANHGSAGPGRECIAGLQLIRTSQGTMPLGGKELPVAQLYQRVHGARVIGRGHPGQRVRLGLLLETNAGTQLPFECQTTVGDDSTWELRFPYPSSPPAGLRYRSPLLLMVGNPSPGKRPQVIDIPGDAVVRGDVVRIDW